MLKFNKMFFALLLIAPCAFGLNNRSAVSSQGLDTNPCTVASPCRSFGAAIAQTTPSGEILALDSAGYGPFTIAGPVTISGAPGVHAAITVTSGTGITINAGASDRIILRNLALIGSGGLKAIDYQNGGDVRVLSCLIRGFLDFGIFASAGSLVVDQSSILDQSASNAVAVYMQPTSGAGNVMVTNSLLEGNDFGVEVTGTAAAVITSSTIAHSTVGVLVLASNLMPASAIVESSTLAFNATGIQAFAVNPGDSATVFLAQDQISYHSTVGVQMSGAGSATVNTFDNNRFTANSSDTSSSLTTIALK